MSAALLKAVLAVRGPFVAPRVASRTVSYLGGASLSRKVIPALLETSSVSRVSPCSFISTSKKNKDAVTVTEKVKDHHPVSTTDNLEEKEENWISFGYSLTDRDHDEWAHHLLMFSGITIALCWGTFIFAYYPDFKNHAWAQREAYLEIERREKNGLPLIDPNMIDVALIDLPSEEELADFEIII